MPSRREFIKKIGKGTVAAGVGLGLGESARAAGTAKASSQSAKEKPARVTDELPIPPPPPPPAQCEYPCDVLVVGGGFAGLNAAMAAKKSGLSVLLVDKGRPGYSGLSAFASGTRWFDKEFGDDAEAYKQFVQIGSEYMANMDWLQVWLEDSKAAYQRLKAWQLLLQLPESQEAGELLKKGDYAGYHDFYAAQDRHAKYTTILEANKIPYLTRTMVTDVIEEGGRIVGAMGFDVLSGVVLTFHAKAVVMCMGSGSYKPSGYPTAGDTFDSEYIGYHLGLPVIGKEFDDFHQTVSVAPGNAFLNNAEAYLDGMGLEGGDITAENAVAQAHAKGANLVARRVQFALNGLPNHDGSKGRLGFTANQILSGSQGSHADDPRHGGSAKMMPSGPRSDVYGAAVGMCCHLTSGIFCGVDDLVGYTGIPGLYVAGDGTNGSAVSGTTYPNGMGFTSNFCSVQGWRAGGAAAKYAQGSAPATIPAAKAAAVTKEILQPLTQKQGLDPNWARDVLQATMAPYWIHIAKSEKALRGALAQVEIMRDEVAPKLMAASPHDLRLCHEMRHKILSAEMKLRAGLERKESRGFHYRSDYPYRDDQNFLCYIALRKGEDGAMKLSKVPIKDAWKGDTGQPYAKRYGWRFPGEAKAKGLPEETKGAGGRG